MKTIKCQCGKDILIDDEDLEKLQPREWSCHSNGNVYEHTGTGRHRTSIPIGDFIIGELAGHIIDHKDLDSHNNQRLNLRHATKSQNGANRKANKGNKWGYKGVGKSYGKWCAKIGVNGKSIWLGHFSSVEDAARAYNEAAKHYFGDFARLNVIPI